jgi:RNA polymerase sigma-70 factor (ECF subfamily)
MDPEARDISVQLLRGIARGDREAFTRFYDRHASLVYTFALRVVRSPADAQELLQDVFVQVWRTAERYDVERGNPEAWLMTLTRSRGIDLLRSRRRKEGRLAYYEDVSQAESAETAEQAPGRAERESAWAVHGALERLAEPQREVLRLAYFDGMTQSEIARRLDLPLGTVKTRMRAGLKALRELFAPRGTEQPS